MIPFCACFRTNVGCVWVRANRRTFTLMSQVYHHLETQAGWDQQVSGVECGVWGPGGVGSAGQ